MVEIIYYILIVIIAFIIGVFVGTSAKTKPKIPFKPQDKGLKQIEKYS